MAKSFAICHLSARPLTGQQTYERLNVPQMVRGRFDKSFTLRNSYVDASNVLILLVAVCRLNKNDHTYGISESSVY